MLVTKAQDQSSFGVAPSVSDTKGTENLVVVNNSLHLIIPVTSIKRLVNPSCMNLNYPLENYLMSSRRNHEKLLTLKIPNDV